jgi:serine protease Do
LPLVISVLALAISLSHGLPGMRVGRAADQKVTDKQKQTLVSLQDAFSSIADSVEPAVVNLQVEPAVTQKASDTGDDNDDDSDTPDQNFNPFGDSPFNFQFPFSQRGAPRDIPRGPATGSGVIIQRTGNEYYILTNNHVVEGGGKIKIQLSGVKEDVPGTLVGTDVKTDLAVVKMRLTGTQGDNRIADFGNSDNVKVGQWAIAIGNPLDVGQTLTVGVISAKGRTIDRIADSNSDYSDMLQTDASINPGNSGGPLVDINGDVIGVNTAIASTTRGSVGIGFAIPSNVAKRIADELIQHGEVVRGYLGVATYEPNWDITPAMAKIYGIDHGAFVENVSPGTPAAKAGIQPEDIVTQWGDTKINNYRDLTNAVGMTAPNTDVPVKLWRDGQEKSLTVRIEKRPSEQTLQDSIMGSPNRGDQGNNEGTQQTVKANGITVSALNSSQRQQVGSAGVVITKVDPNSTAADQGLQPGVVILRVNRTTIATLDDFKAAMDKIGANDAYMLRVSLRASNGAWMQRTIIVDANQDQ